MSSRPIAASNTSSAPKLTAEQLLHALEDAVKLKTENRMAFFKPYAKQEYFCDLSLTKRELLLMAGNQLGKSTLGAFMTTCHLTGIYPKWWKGKKFTKPVKAWAAGESSLVVRDVQQKLLCGEPGVLVSRGTGMIPKDLFLDSSLSRGVTDAFDSIQVRHVSGGVSVLRFKSYEQGRTKFQGETLDFGWCDEEPNEDIYGEFLTRLAEGGRMILTFTPLKGRSKVVLRFLEQRSADRAVVTMELSEVKHFSDEEKKRRVEGYASHERDAREKGIPILGSGAVYQFGEDLIREDAIRDVPPHWAKLWGIDIGIDHPFAAVLSLYDRDLDVIHIHHTIRQTDCLPLQNATAMKYVAAAVPVAWPHDAHLRQQGSDTAEELASIYRRHGLNMLHTHSTFESGGYSREAAVTDLAERAKTGRFKVASHLSDWFSEFRLYHRKDGLIVRQEDDLMSATEKVIMMKRHARPVPLGSKVAKRRTGGVAQGTQEVYFGID